MTMIGATPEYAVRHRPYGDDSRKVEPVESAESGAHYAQHLGSLAYTANPRVVTRMVTPWVDVPRVGDYVRYVGRRGDCAGVIFVVERVCDCKPNLTQHDRDHFVIKNILGDGEVSCRGLSHVHASSVQIVECVECGWADDIAELAEVTNTATGEPMWLCEQHDPARTRKIEV